MINFNQIHFTALPSSSIFRCLKQLFSAPITSPLWLSLTLMSSVSRPLPPQSFFYSTEIITHQIIHPTPTTMCHPQLHVLCLLTSCLFSTEKFKEAHLLFTHSVHAIIIPRAIPLSMSSLSTSSVSSSRRHSPTPYIEIFRSAASSCQP